MNATDWRTRGHIVIFHCGIVFIIHLKTGCIYQQNIDSGRWIDNPDLFIGVSIHDLLKPAQEHIESALKKCYCNSLSGSTCDYCSGTRI